MSDGEARALVAGAQRLKVGQVKEWGEILSGFETKNKYVIRDEHNQPLFLAAEEAGGLGDMLIRAFLKALRPFTMKVMDQQGGQVLSLNRPFRFFFHRLEIADAHGRPIGAVQKRFSLLRRIYVVENAEGLELLTLFGPVFRPWTFTILKDGQEVGKIQKRWSGLGRELFTDADNFGIEFSPLLDAAERMLLIAAIFLIDFVHFENKGN